MLKVREMKHLYVLVLITGVLLAQWCVCGPECSFTETSDSSACCSGCASESDTEQKEDSCDCFMCSVDISSELVETAEAFCITGVPQITAAPTDEQVASLSSRQPKANIIPPPGPPAYIAFGIQLT